MPTYQYACTECGSALEAQQSFTDEPLSTCPECSGRLRKVFSAVGVVFKGSGFYRNDSRSEPATADGSKSDGATSDAAKGDGAKEAGAGAGGKESASSNGTKGGGAEGTKKPSGPTSAASTASSTGSAA